MPTRNFGGTFDPVHDGHLAIAEAALVAQSLVEVIWLPQIFPAHKSAITPIQHRWAMVELAIAPYPQFHLPAPLEFWCNSLGGDLSTLSTPTSLSKLSTPLTPTSSTFSEPIPPQIMSTPDYAIHQWQSLKNLYPQSNWCWILGADSFLTLPRWKGREVLIPACKWLVATRNQWKPHMELLEPQKLSESPELQNFQQVIKEIHLQGLSITWQILPMPSIDISSTSIRQSFQSRQALSSLEKSLPASVQQYVESHNLYRY
ncbi:MAG: adenylyltransferase/cytidyltransferase family protein [Coleofasciculaceae cyanobacterium SM2_1_6]|nr:adenylyltransferase/cytidyltransferase family protein [Coleofasciculaceae cyanobacterium SM2_1_6]